MTGASVSSAVRRTHRLGAQPGGAGAGLPEHRDRGRERDDRRDGRRAGLGELAGVPQLRQPLGDALLPARRFAQRHREPARVGQRGVDDALLPGRRPGGEASARPWRAARPAAACGPGDGGALRDRIPGGDLSGLERGRSGRPWLGRGDLDRHRLCAGGRRPAGATLGHASAGVPAVAGGRGRPCRAGGRRRRLHAARVGRGAGGRRWPVRPAARAALAARRAATAGAGARHRRLVRDVRVGDRSGRSPGSRSVWRRAPTRPRARRSREQSS